MPSDAEFQMLIARVDELEGVVAPLRAVPAQLDTLNGSVEKLSADVSDLADVITGPKDSVVTRLAVIETVQGGRGEIIAADTAGRWQMWAVVVSSTLSMIGVLAMAIATFLAP